MHPYYLQVYNGNDNAMQVSYSWLITNVTTSTLIRVDYKCQLESTMLKCTSLMLKCTAVKGI